MQFYRRGIYRCNNKYKAKVRCTNPGILSERIRHAPVTAVNARVADKNELFANNHPVAETLCDCTEFEQEQAALVEVIMPLFERMRGSAFRAMRSRLSPC